jgi:hypothetical protein
MVVAMSSNYCTAAEGKRGPFWAEAAVLPRFYAPIVKSSAQQQVSQPEPQANPADAQLEEEVQETERLKQQHLPSNTQGLPRTHHGDRLDST